MFVVHLQNLSHSKVFIVIIIIASNILLWTGIIVQDGIIINRDFNYPIFKENFERRYYPLWNDLTSQPNVENSMRLVMMSPFLALTALGIQVSVVLKIMLISTFSLLTITTYFFLMKLFGYINLPAQRYELVIVAGAFLFAYNPVSLQFAGALPLLLSVSILPLLLYLILTKINSRLFPLYVSGCLLLSLGHPFTFVMNVLIAILFAVLVYKDNFRLLFTRVLVSSLLFFTLFAWFWLPYIIYPTTSIELGRENQAERSVFDVISENEIYKVLLLERDRFIYVDTYPDDFRGVIHFISLSLVVIIGFLTFLLGKGKRILTLLIFLSGGYLIFTLVSLGSKGPLGDYLFSFITSAPLGWIFRSPLKFQLYQAFFISVLFMIGILLLRLRISNKAIPILLIITALVGVSYYGIYNANVTSLNPINIPDPYLEINELLSTYNDTFKGLYYPLYDEQPTNWSKGHRISPFDSRSSKIPTYELFTNYNFVREVLYDYPYNNDLLTSSSFYKFLISIGIKYIVFHDDRIFSIAYGKDMENLRNLLRSEIVNLVHYKDGWYLFEIDYGKTVNSYISHNPVRALDSLIITDRKEDIYDLSIPTSGVIDTNTYKSLYKDLISEDQVNRSELSFPNYGFSPDISATKVRPYLWSVEVSTDYPFILAFTETYDDGWIARNGDMMSNSFRLDGLINGFFIEKVGDYTLTIEYMPQRLFFYGLIISVVTFIIYFLAIFLVKNSRFSQIMKRGIHRIVRR